MSGPQFLGIGIQKSGTTWLYQNLAGHPDIWMPHEKELHYWGDKADRPLGLWQNLTLDNARATRWRRQAQRQIKKYGSVSEWSNLGWDMRYFLRKPSDTWYAGLFRPGRDKVTGEITPDYSTLSNESIAHIREVAPDTRLILFLRNPIERSYSHAQMEFRGEARSDDLDERYIDHFQSRRSRRHGDYLRTIEAWSDQFPEEQIYIGYLEDVHFRPGMLINSVYEFLGVDPDRALPVIRQPVHVGSASTIPTQLATALATLYESDLRKLGRFMGGHAERWHRMARILRETPPSSEEIEYPFWESALWPQVWHRAEEGKPPPNSSGPLNVLLEKRRKEVRNDNG